MQNFILLVACLLGFGQKLGPSRATLMVGTGIPLSWWVLQHFA